MQLLAPAMSVVPWAPPGQKRATLFICGDDAAAKTAVSRLAQELGFDVADVGDLAAARWLEPMAMIWISLAARKGLGRDIAFRLMRR